MAGSHDKRRPGPRSVYPWLRRDYFKTSVSYLVSLAIHAGVLLLLLASMMLDGGGGTGTEEGGTGKLFSILAGQGHLETQTERTDKSDSLENAIAKAVEEIEPLPVVASQVTPDLADVGVQLSDVAPKINPTGTASSLRAVPGSTGGGMAVGPGLGMGGGMGGGIGRGFGRGFGDFVGLMQTFGFDVAFVIDGTNSMQFAIDTVKARVRDLVGQIQHLVPNARVGFVIYKDKGDDFTVRMSSLSFHADKLESFIKYVRAGGGGDYTEAVYEGMRTAIEELGWREFARRVIVLVPSSPPHTGDEAALQTLVKNFHAKGGLVHVLDLSEMMHRNYQIALQKALYGAVTDPNAPLPGFYLELQNYFAGVAKAGGGELIRLGDEGKLAGELMVAAFGPQWRKEVSRSAAEQ